MNQIFGQPRKSEELVCQNGHNFKASDWLLLPILSVPINLSFQLSARFSSLSLSTYDVVAAFCPECKRIVYAKKRKQPKFEIQPPIKFSGIDVAEKRRQDAIHYYNQQKQLGNRP
jgi:hypothetical protein